ncbi:MAG: hypothetical protein JWP89_92 [Schlesneria sp.]|nr:hypothetical protein [Schlesneria sp.]
MVFGGAMRHKDHFPKGLDTAGNREVRTIRKRIGDGKLSIPGLGDWSRDSSARGFPFLPRMHHS